MRSAPSVAARPSGARTRRAGSRARRSPPRARPPPSSPRAARCARASVVGHARRRGTARRWGRGRRRPPGCTQVTPGIAVSAGCRKSRRRRYSAARSGHELLGAGQGLDRGHLREGGRALRAVGDEGRAGVDERARAQHPADAPAGHAVALGRGAQHHEAVARRVAQRLAARSCRGAPKDEARVGVVVEQRELAPLRPCRRSRAAPRASMTAPVGLQGLFTMHGLRLRGEWPSRSGAP